MTNNLFRSKLFWLGLAVVLLIGAGLFLGSMASAPLLYKFSNSGTWFIPLLVAAAVTDSINICAFSVLLLTVAFLISLGRVRTSIMKIGFSYIAGIFIVYLLIGLGILQALHLFNTPHFMAKVGATLLIVLGAINIINEFFPAFPLKLRLPQAAHGKMAELMEKGSMPTAFLLGGLVGLCEFPCTGGPYLMVLGLLHDKATYFKGVAYLFLYNLIFILPLVAILILASNKDLLGKVQEWRKVEAKNMRFWIGIAMIVLGLLIFAL